MKKVILIDGNNILFRSYFATAYKGTIFSISHYYISNDCGQIPPSVLILTIL